MFSASVADALLMADTTSGYTNLIDKIAEERRTGQPCESISFKGNKYTDRGHKYEPMAAFDFEMKHLTTLQTVGVVIKDDWCLCSPDRLWGDDKLVQIKCPIYSTQKEYLRKKAVPTKYYKQMQFELFCCEDRKSDIFYSFHPNLPALEIEVFPDEKMFRQFEDRLKIAKEVVLTDIEYWNNFKI
jgi:hypothetical protein